MNVYHYQINFQEIETEKEDTAEQFHHFKYAKTFSGAMKDYMKPYLRNPSVINLACQLKNEMHEVSFSTIILRTDDKR